MRYPTAENVMLAGCVKTADSVDSPEALDSGDYGSSAGEEPCGAQCRSIIDLGKFYSVSIHATVDWRELTFAPLHRRKHIGLSQRE